MHCGAGDSGAFGKVLLVPAAAGGGISGEGRAKLLAQAAVFHVAVAG